MRKGQPEPIGDVVKTVVEKLSRAKDKQYTAIFAAWKASAGRELARHTRPAGLRSGTLRVWVDNSAWLYQANLQKEQLLARLKQKLGEKKIQNILLRMGKVK